MCVRVCVVVLHFVYYACCDVLVCIRVCCYASSYAVVWECRVVWLVRDVVHGCVDVCWCVLVCGVACCRIALCVGG